MFKMGNAQTTLTPGRQWADKPFKLIETPRHAKAASVGSPPPSPQEQYNPDIE
jgi:hemerythrin superfamily protein